MTHRTDAQDDSLAPANTQKQISVSRADLPLSCPMAKQKLWNAHPRVYLSFADGDAANCPYCGTHYVLTG